MIDQNSISAINDSMSYSANQGISHFYLDDKVLNENYINIRGQQHVNFGSCSYLGLEFDPRIIKGGQDALANYGSQLSASRAYMSSNLYLEFENKLTEIFQCPFVVTPTTTLGHIATIPVIVEKNDAIILDHQVHSSVQTAVQLIKANGNTIKMIRHSNMDMLETMIIRLKEKHDKVWYMADGIYSMYGDKAPMNDLHVLMDKYPQFNVYIDDAHGMSCFGERGQGFVLNERPIRPQLIVAVSFAKAFASGGAAILFHNEELANKVKRSGIPMITSGPIQPSVLGCSVASAEIHLSSEYGVIQSDLKENIKYTNLLLKKNHLPLLHENDGSIFFIGAGLPRVGANIIKRLMNDNFYTNIGIFPAVPIKNTGVRFTITRLHTFEQIENMIECLAYHYPLALKEEKVTLNEVKKAFKLKTDEDHAKTSVESLIKYSNLSLNHCDSIKDVNRDQWDSKFESEINCLSENLITIESSFKKNSEIENNWDFDYLTVYDNDQLIAATFLTTSLQKDDMLHPSEISEQVELVRINEDNPYYLTTRSTSIGSPVTLGEHLFIDKNSKKWKEALEMIIDKIADIQKNRASKNVSIRDFAVLDENVQKTIRDGGFFKMDTYKNNTLETVPESIDLLLTQVSKKSRKHIKKKALNNLELFKTNIVTSPTESQIDFYYDLYSNVKRKKVEINTYPLPKKYFSNLGKNPNWEIMELIHIETNEVVGIMFNYRKNKTFQCSYIGLNYDYQEYNIYSKMIYLNIERAIECKAEKVELGITADFEKQRFGATTKQMFAYVQVEDHFNLELLSSSYSKTKNVTFS